MKSAMPEHPLRPPPPPYPPNPFGSLSRNLLEELSLAAVVVSSTLIALLVALLVLLVVARNDKPVRAVGVSFLVYLLVGSLCGQGFLLSHARESHTLAIRLASDDRSAGYELTTTWAQCHTQSTLLIMYLMLYSAPMTAKLWRVWSKIRNADTYRLELWDGRARQIAAEGFRLGACGPSLVLSWATVVAAVPHRLRCGAFVPPAS